MNSTEWARRVDRVVEDVNYRFGEHHRETAWALGLGFASADDYWAAVSETFTEELHQDRLFAGNAE